MAKKRRQAKTGPCNYRWNKSKKVYRRRCSTGQRVKYTKRDGSTGYRCRPCRWGTRGARYYGGKLKGRTIYY